MDRRHLAALAAAALMTAASARADTPAPPAPDAAQLQAMHARFAPVELRADISKLPPNERAALREMLAAAKVIDALFLRQAWAGNEALLLHLLGDASPVGQARLRYFLLNKGPWSRLDGDAPFVPDAPAKPAAANFYPAGATKAEIEAWLKSLSDGERAEATGFFTVVRRTPQGAFQTVPYSLEYQGELAEAAAHLRVAAALTAQPTLKRFLETRADAFVSNDYYASDVAWMELDASVEPTLGPYETYEDGWFSSKAAFEAFIALRDDDETRKLQRFSRHLQELEDHLPIEPALRNPKLGALAPIRVVNLVLAAGDGHKGVQTLAFNLPNDERVVSEKGSKRVLLKNSNEAKFQTVLLPIARVALPAADQRDVSFDAFFTHVLMHELMHGLGPQTVTVGGRASTVRQELKETYSTLEEAKADISGLWALQYLADKGEIDAAVARTMYTTFLASAFRSIRFGTNDAHGRGLALQLNTLLDAGAVRANPDGTFGVDPARIRQAVTGLTAEIMTIQARGDYAKAKELLATRGVVRPEVHRVLDNLGTVPVDIAPRFVTAEELTRE